MTNHCSAPALLVLCLAAAADANAQPLVRMNAGQGATLFNVGDTARLDVRLRAIAPGDLRGAVTVDNMRLVARVCCPGVGQPAIRCESDHGVPVGATATVVRDRHGPPATASSAEMRYPGIVFGLGGSPARVNSICVANP